MLGELFDIFDCKKKRFFLLKNWKVDLETSKYHVDYKNFDESNLELAKSRYFPPAQATDNQTLISNIKLSTKTFLQI